MWRIKCARLHEKRVKEKEQTTSYILWALIALKNALSSHSTISLLLAWINRMTRVTSKTEVT